LLPGSKVNGQPCEDDETDAADDDPHKSTSAERRRRGGSTGSLVSLMDASEVKRRKTHWEDGLPRGMIRAEPNVANIKNRGIEEPIVAIYEWTLKDEWSCSRKRDVWAKRWWSERVCCSTMHLSTRFKRSDTMKQCDSRKIPRRDPRIFAMKKKADNVTVRLSMKLTCIAEFKWQAPRSCGTKTGNKIHSGDLPGAGTD
jgi:hypothetical protein